MGGLREKPLCLSTPHTSCITNQRMRELQKQALPQHTSYELHPGAHVTSRLGTGSLPQHTSYELHRKDIYERATMVSFASAHLIRAASAKLHREMDAAL